MKVLCISASNVMNYKKNSASTKTCQIIKKIVEENSNIKADILALSDLELKPCIMCAECSNTGMCINDDGFNNLYMSIKAADGIFVVCPHYAPIPSKLVMILEKLEEMAFLHSCSKKDDSLYPLLNKPVAIIAHGGCTGNVDEYYKNELLKPLASAFRSVAMDVVGVDNDWPDGIVFGIEAMKESDRSILPDMIHDYDYIQNRITPLIKQMLLKLDSKTKL